MTTRPTQPAELHATLLTPAQPGAIAIIQLAGPPDALDAALAQLTAGHDFPAGSMRLTRFIDDDGEIDTGLIARLDRLIVHLMPHGGLRVVQRLLTRCVEVGISIQRPADLPPRELFPEAADDYEALMLVALSRAQSPAALDLLLDQPRRWRSNPTLTADDRARSHRLSRLIDPPLVVLAGPANVGKSTLSNRLLGWTMSIAVDQPGTTRDYTAGMIELLDVVVHWHDTPGLRETDDPIEREAIELARKLMQRADLLIAMTDHEHDWPVLPRASDLRVACKCDIARRDDADFNISNVTGAAIPALVSAVRDMLVPPADREHPGPWLFDERLLDV